MIDKNKTYKTRDGREARIYATDGAAPYFVHGAVLDDGDWIPEIWTIAGKFTDDGSGEGYDLIEVKPKRTIEFWVNVHKSECTTFFIDGQIARDTSEKYDCIACLHFTREFEEGEGL